MARWRAAGSSPLPVIARRSCYRRRTASGEHGRVDLATEKLGGVVQEMRNDGTKRIGGRRGAGVVGAVAGVGLLPTAMAARRGRAQAAWRRIG